MPYTVRISAPAQKQICKLPPSTRERILRRLDELAEAPRPSGVVKIAGEEDEYRVRVGNYRILYRIYDRELLVMVVRVAHRREAYRR